MDSSGKETGEDWQAEVRCIAMRCDSLPVTERNVHR